MQTVFLCGDLMVLHEEMDACDTDGALLQKQSMK